MILRTRGADGSWGCTHERGWFAVPRAVAVGTRRPINGIFQYTGHGVIVFRRNKQNSIRLAYPSFQLRDFGRRVLFLVLVKDRDTVELESFENRAFGQQFGGRAQSRAIVRFAAQTAGDTENADWVIHVMRMLAKSLRVPD